MTAMFAAIGGCVALTSSPYDVRTADTNIAFNRNINVNHCFKQDKLAIDLNTKNTRQLFRY